jgi:SAM-dependent methyltransferase
MKKSIKHNLGKAKMILKLFGIDPLAFITTVRALPFYFRDFAALKKQKGSDIEFPFGRSFPILHERFEASGTMSGAYFQQDLYIATKVFINKPVRHIDIGSRTDGFVAHVAVFREIEIFDIRDQKSKVENIIFKQADLMNLPVELINYCDSISSLHAIEHFGLGRYGDPVDFYGHEKAIENIYKILKSNGKFYFSVPMGTQRIEFNAHRIFGLQYLLKLLQKRFLIESFSYVDDKGDLFKNVVLTADQIKSDLNCTYGCAIFELIKDDKK